MDSCNNGSTNDVFGIPKILRENEAFDSGKGKMEGAGTSSEKK